MSTVKILQITECNEIVSAPKNINTSLLLWQALCKLSTGPVGLNIRQRVKNENIGLVLKQKSSECYESLQQSLMLQFLNNKRVSLFENRAWIIYDNNFSSSLAIFVQNQTEL